MNAYHRWVVLSLAAVAVLFGAVAFGVDSGLERRLPDSAIGSIRGLDPSYNSKSQLTCNSINVPVGGVEFAKCAGEPAGTFCYSCTGSGAIGQDLDYSKKVQWQYVLTRYEMCGQLSRGSCDGSGMCKNSQITSTVCAQNLPYAVEQTKPN